MPLTHDARSAERVQSSQAQYRSLLSYFVVRICAVVTIAVLLLAAVELYSFKRYAGGNDVLEPAAKIDEAEQGTPDEREFWKEFQQSDRVVYHQYVLWRRAPYQGRLINIDEEGIRRTLHTHCDNRTFTIWTFGDSVMWGSAVADSDTIPSLIAQEYKKAGKPVCIVNYAEKGWSNTQETIELIEQLKSRRRPDVVLFYDGGTEAFSAYQSGRADVHTNFAMFKGFLENWRKTQRPNFIYLQQTNTYRFLKRIASRIASRQQPAQPADSIDIDKLSAEVVRNYRQNMDVVDLLAKQNGFRAIYAWYPNLAVGHKQMTAVEQRLQRSVYREFPGLGPMYQAVYGRADEIKSDNFHSLANAVDDRPDTLYIGISHMNAQGDQLIADRLFGILQAPNALPSAGASVGR